MAIKHKSLWKSKTFKICLQMSLTAIMFFAESLTGYFTNCMALMSDSFHTLSDVISLSIGLLAIRTTLKQTQDNSRKTFGYNRAEVLGGIIQAVFLYALCFNIFIEGVKRFFNPEKQNDIMWIMIVGTIGFFVNLTGLLIFCETGEDLHDIALADNSELLKKEKEKENETELNFIASAVDLPIVKQNNSDEGNMNTRGIFLHIMGDTLASLVVIISAGLLWYFDNDVENMPYLMYIDPSLTIFISIVIACSTYPLLTQSISILMEHAPKDINIETFQNNLRERVWSINLGPLSQTVPKLEVSELLEKDMDPDLHSKMVIHDLHIWQLSSKTRAATVHVVIPTLDDPASQPLKQYIQIVKYLRKQFEAIGVTMLTIQPEFLAPKGLKTVNTNSSFQTSLEKITGMTVKSASNSVSIELGNTDTIAGNESKDEVIDINFYP